MLAQFPTIPTNRVSIARIAVTAIIAHTDHVRPLIDFTVSFREAIRSSSRGSLLPGVAGGVAGATRVRCAAAGGGAAGAATVCDSEPVDGLDAALIGVSTISAPSAG